MGTLWRSLVVAVALLVAGVVSAQERGQGQGWLGVELQDVTKEEADKFGWDAPRGAKVMASSAGSPADKAGVRAGDIIVAIERTQIDTASELNAAIEAKGPGAQVLLGVLSGGRERRVAATLAERPKAQAAVAGTGLHLMLDTGGHMAGISGVAFTPDGKHIVSASIDKTVRVWSVDTGRTVRLIRGEARGDAGSIDTMALSPDGRWLAVGGRFHKADRAVAGAIRLYDFASGRLETLLKGHQEPVLALAFSPDSKRLISGSWDKTAIIWDLGSRQQVLRLSGHPGSVRAVAFSSDGDRAVTGNGEDAAVRLWSAADGRLIAEMTEHRKRLPANWIGEGGVTSLAVSPVDHLIASGGEDGVILLWDGRTGAFLRQVAKLFAPQPSAAIRSLHFSPDGRRLLSTHDIEGCLVLDVATGAELLGGESYDQWTAFGPTSSKTGRKVSSEDRARCNGPAMFSQDGRSIAARFNSDLQIVEPRTSKAIALKGAGAPVYAVGFARDGRAIAWGEEKEGYAVHNKLRRELHLPLDGAPLGRAKDIDPRLAACTASTPSRNTCPDPELGRRKYLRGAADHGSWRAAYKSAATFLMDASVLEVYKDAKLEDGRRQGGVLHAQFEVGNDASERSPIAYAPDGQAVLLGRASEIRAYELNGGLLGSFVGHDGAPWDLAPSHDGRFLVTGGLDQTVRLWNLKTRELIVSLFHGTDGEWAMWTPQGYYTGSPGADKIVGWQINKGPDEAADYVGAEQLRQHLNRPDIVERAIVLASAEDAVREAPGTSFKLGDLLARPVPRFRIVAPAAGAAQRGGHASVKVDIEATPDPVRLIRVHVNGRQVEEQTPDVGSGGFGAGERLLQVPLAKGRNEVRIALTNAIGEKAETLALVHDGEGGLDQRGTLHILAIGVNDYKGLGNACGGGSCDLKYSVADARKLAEAVEKQLGPDHVRVVKRVLVNGSDAKDVPTAGNIIDAVELLRQARETDTVVLFISGHGKNEGPDYRFLPTDAEWTGAALRGSTVVPWQVLQSAVEAAKGRRILFVDTCHSGNAYNQRLGNAAYHANIVAYTASRFDQEAIEDPALGHGLFTYAMVEGLEGQGRLGAKRPISTKDLAAYVTRRVDELAKALKGEQEPQYFKGRDADDYVLARR